MKFSHHTLSLQFTLSSLLQLRTFRGSLLPRTTENWLITPPANSYKPLIWHARKRFNCHCWSVTSLLTRSRDPSSLLRHASVYSCCLATNDARRCEAMSDSSRLDSARRKHRFVYCCVNAGACFDVTVLAWRKYATILSSRLGPVFLIGLFPSGFPAKSLYAFFFTPCALHALPIAFSFTS
jgi:hypothetical protein